jgi:NAD(P)-dependent dehydrogenase (short-subunit alcohol dehydrogenase family)
VTDENQVKDALDQAVQEGGGLHGVINCAGVATPGKILGREGVHDLDQFRKVIQINLIGTFNVSRLAAERMADNDINSEGERGLIITTASVAAFEGQIGQAAYSASKGGVAAMTLPIARELGKQGIRMVCIAPGVFETPMMAGMKPEVQESLISQVPFPPRLGKPEDYALMVCQIMDNVMLNGCVIRLDGAIRMGAR